MEHIQTNKIKLEIFEGPLDLLINLISKEEIDIFDIPISKITEQYMSYLYKMNELDIDLAGEFVVMAAQLLEIKSKMLLPKTDEEDAEDPREELARRLAQYRIYKMISEYIKQKEPRYNSILTKDREFYPELSDITEKIDINSEMLFNALSLLLKKHSVRIDKTFDFRIDADEVSTKAKIDEITDMLKEKKQISFFSLVLSDPRRANITAVFLAVLELLKNNVVCLSQEVMYGDIIISKVEQP